jgi:hypothetical protein
LRDIQEVLDDSCSDFCISGDILEIINFHVKSKRKVFYRQMIQVWRWDVICESGRGQILWPYTFRQFHLPQVHRRVDELIIPHHSTLLCWSKWLVVVFLFFHTLRNCFFISLCVEGVKRKRCTPMKTERWELRWLCVYYESREQKIIIKTICYLGCLGRKKRVG